MTAPLRVAVIGGGFGQHVHVPAFRRDPRATVEAICVSTEERARALAARHGIPRASGDWRRLVTDPAIDVVSVCLPPALQAEVAIAAARAGKHVFAEKPLALNAGETRAMASAVRAAGVVGAVDFEFRHVAAWQRAREIVRGGTLGRIRHAYVNWRVETLAHRDPRPSWKRDPRAGGGTLSLFASHSLDAMRWMLGPVYRLAARLHSRAAEEADARVDAWLELQDGTPVSISIAADATTATEHRVEIYGNDAAIVLENATSDYTSGFTLMLRGRGEPRATVALAPDEPGSDGRIVAVGALVRRFVDAIVEGRPVSPDFEDGHAVQVLIDSIRDADRTGTWQTPS